MRNWLSILIGIFGVLIIIGGLVVFFIDSELFIYYSFVSAIGSLGISIIIAAILVRRDK